MLRRLFLMGIEKPAIAVFDAKPYDRDYIPRASGADKLDWRFQEFQLNAKTVLAADGAQAVCVFVNDVLNREVLERLAVRASGWLPCAVRDLTMSIWRPPRNLASP
jgi:hypothetical protein